MAQQLVTALETALSECAAADLSTLPAADVAALVVDLRRVACRLEAEIARVVHAVASGEVWRASGATSLEVWLANQTNTSVRSARDQVRLADTLAAAPVVAERMAEGGLSIDNARLLGAVVGQPGFAGDAGLLLEIASGSPRDTRRGLESWLAMTDPAGEPDREEALWLQRHVTFTKNSDGMYDVHGLLMAADVAVVRVALEYIAGAAFADETGRSHHTRMSVRWWSCARPTTPGPSRVGVSVRKCWWRCRSKPWSSADRRGGRLSVRMTRSRVRRYAGCVVMPS